MQLSQLGCGALAGSTRLVDTAEATVAGAAAGASAAAGADSAAPWPAAARTSCLRIRPPTPVPVTVRKSTPCLSASLRTSGVTYGTSSLLFTLACAAGGVATDFGASTLGATSTFSSAAGAAGAGVGAAGSGVAGSGVAGAALGSPMRTMTAPTSTVSSSSCRI